MSLGIILSKPIDAALYLGNVRRQLMKGLRLLICIAIPPLYLPNFFPNRRVSTSQLYSHEHELLRELAQVDSALDAYDRRAEVCVCERLRSGAFPQTLPQHTTLQLHHTALPLGNVERGREKFQK